MDVAVGFEKAVVVVVAAFAVWRGSGVLPGVGHVDGRLIHFGNQVLGRNWATVIIVLRLPSRVQIQVRDVGIRIDDQFAIVRLQVAAEVVDVLTGLRLHLDLFVIILQPSRTSLLIFGVLNL